MTNISDRARRGCMGGQKNKKRFLRSNSAKGKKILKKAQLIARRNALHINKNRPVKLIESSLLIPRHCILSGCDSTGHLNGTDDVHITLSGCPRYHNVSPDYIKTMLQREEGLAPSSKPDSALKHTIELDGSSSQKYSICEPNLEELASGVVLYQFRRAQQKLVSNMDREVQEHLITCARLDELVKKSTNPTSSASSLIDSAMNSAPSVENFANNINCIVFGEFQMQTWYSSPYPPTFACLPMIYICEFCLTYMRQNIAYRRHRLRCKRKFPPGNEIYRKEKLSFFEVDGAQQKEYCRNICLLAKLYLKQKTVHELDSVPAFMFYILTEADEAGCHIIGYFSKHKPEEQGSPSPTSTYNNLSCLLIMPHYQRKGFGRMLVEFSYILSRLEGRVGSPERPLSDHGLIVYQRYWRWEVVSFLLTYEKKDINIRSISEATGIDVRDIVSTLLDLGLLKYIRTVYYIVNDKKIFRHVLSEMRAPDDSRSIDQARLCWCPTVKNAALGYDNFPPLSSF